MNYINKIILEEINKFLLREENDSEHPFYDYLSEYDAYEIMRMFRNGEPLFSGLIKPSMYKKALDEFMQYGELYRFPKKYIYEWFNLIMRNTAILSACTEIYGHSTYFPFEEIYDSFFDEDDEDKWESYKEEKGIDDDSDAMYEYLEDIGFYDWCCLPDNTWACSDYGVQPLEKIISEYHEGMSAEEVLVLINRALDVTHHRGDLSSIFIEGGTSSLYKISN